MNMMGQAASQMAPMIGSAGSTMGSMGQMMSHPMASGAMMAAGGYAAGKGLLSHAGTGLLRNPLVLLAAGLTAGYLLHKYEKEIIQAVAQATGMGRDFMLNQKENLDDLIAESQTSGTTPPAAATTVPTAQE